MNHSIPLALRTKFGFGKKFTNWIEAILKKPEPSVTNSEKTTKYFTLNSSTDQGDPI